MFTILLHYSYVSPRNLCKLSKYYPFKKPTCAGSIQVTHTRNLFKLSAQETCPLSKLPTQETYQSSVQVTHKRNNNYFLYVHIPTHQTSQDKTITSSREEELEVSCLYIPLCCMQSKVNCNAIVLVTQFVVLQMQLPLKLSKRMRRLFPYLVSIHIHVLMYYMSGM